MATKVMHQVHGLTMLECGCRAQQQEPHDGQPLRLLYIEHCPLHAAAPRMLEALTRIVLTMGDCERHGLVGPLSSGEALLSLAKDARAILRDVEG